MSASPIIDPLAGAAPARRTSSRLAAAQAAVSAAARSVEPAQRAARADDDGFAYGSEMDSLLRSASRARLGVPLTGSKRKRSTKADAGGTTSESSGISSSRALEPASKRSATSASAEPDSDAAALAAAAESGAGGTSSSAGGGSSADATASVDRSTATATNASDSAAASPPAARGSSAVSSSGGRGAAARGRSSAAATSATPSRAGSSTSAGAASGAAAQAGNSSSGSAAAVGAHSSRLAVQEPEADSEEEEDGADDDGEDTDASRDVGRVHIERQYMRRAREALEIDQYRMSKSRAKGEYALSDKDLATLTYDLGENPHYASAAPMILYNVAQLQDLCLDKYGDVEGLALKLQKNANAAAKRRATIAAQPPKPRRSRFPYDDYDDDDDDGSSRGSWRSPEPGRECKRCKYNTAALECAFGMCCHCCKDMGMPRVCLRHSNEYI